MNSVILLYIDTLILRHLNTLLPECLSALLSHKNKSADKRGLDPFFFPDLATFPFSANLLHFAIIFSLHLSSPSLSFCIYASRHIKYRQVILQLSAGSELVLLICLQCHALCIVTSTDQRGSVDCKRPHCWRISHPYFTLIFWDDTSLPQPCLHLHTYCTYCTPYVFHQVESLARGGIIDPLTKESHYAKLSHLCSWGNCVGCQVPSP